MKIDNSESINREFADLIKYWNKHKNYFIGNTKIDVNAPIPGEGDYTPLHLAVLAGDLEGVESLLQQQADYLLVNSYSERPLDYAVFLRDTSILSLLLDHAKKHNLDSFPAICKSLSRLAEENNKPEIIPLLQTQLSSKKENPRPTAQPQPPGVPRPSLADRIVEQFKTKLQGKINSIEEIRAIAAKSILSLENIVIDNDVNSQKRSEKAIDTIKLIVTARETFLIDKTIHDFKTTIASIKKTDDKSKILELAVKAKNIIAGTIVSTDLASFTRAEAAANKINALAQQQIAALSPPKPSTNKLSLFGQGKPKDSAAKPQTKYMHLYLRGR